MAEHNLPPDFTITPPDLSSGAINMGAGAPTPYVPQAPQIPDVEQYYPERFQQPLYEPTEASTANINAITDNFLNTMPEQNVLKPTSVIGDFHTSDYGMNTFMDRYYHHNKFSDLGFSPFVDNEKIYNEASSGWDEFSRAAGQWANLSGLAFTDAMSFGDMNDTGTAEKFKRAMDIGSSTDTGKFGTNLFLNSGYTLGIMGELIMEEVALGLAAVGLGIAEVPTFGGATPLLAADLSLMGARATMAATKIGRAWQATKNFGKTLKSFKDINKAREAFMAGGKATMKFLNPLENTLNFARNRKKVFALNKADNTTDALAHLKTATRGFAEFYKDARNIRLAFGEGSLEGGMVENQMVNDLYNDWKAAHPGEKMPDSVANEIKQTAYKAGRLTTLTNTPVILYSNKIVLDGILKPGKFSKRLVGDITETGMGKILFNPKKYVKDAYSKLPKGYFAKRWAYAKNPRLWLAGAQRYTSANFAEGLQESAQEIIAGGNEDYYTAQFKGDITRGGYYSYVAQNIGHQFTAEGGEVFLSGFLMGGIAGPISNRAGQAMSGVADLFDPNSDLRIRGFKYSEQEDGTGSYFGLGKVGRKLGIATGTKEQIAEAEQLDRKRKERIDEVVKTLNEFNNDPEKYLSPELINMVTQKELNTMMREAEKEGDVKGYYDFKNSAGFKHVLTALRYGRLGTHINQLKELSNLTEEEIQQSYGISKVEFDNEINKSVERAERIQQRWNKVKKLYPNPFDPSQYANDGKLRIQAALGKLAWDNALEEFVFNQDAFDNAQSRLESILEKAKDKANLKNTPFSEFNSLFTLKDTQNEIDLLKKEIQALEEGGTKKSDPTLKNKKLKLNALEKFAEAMTQAKVERTESGTEDITARTRRKAQTAFNRYVKILARENGDYTSDEDLSDVFEDLLDYATLEERSQKAIDAANLFANPEYFQEQFQRILTIQQKLYDNKKEEIEASLKIYLKSMDKNEMLQELHKAGMFFSIEELEQLEKDGTVPKTFYYTNISNKAGAEVSDLEVQKNTDDYDKAIAILKKYYTHLTGLPITQEKIGDPYNASVRAPLDNDNRTFEDLAEQFGFDPNAVEAKVPLKQVLQTIMESDFATEQEKLLAAELATIANDLEYVTFSTTMSKPGEYSTVSQTKVDARFSATNYNKAKIMMPTEKGLMSAEGRNIPIEVTILRYELERRVTESLNQNQEFSDNINTLKNAAMARFTEMANNGMDVDFAFLNFLESSEGFIQGAMTDKNFQTFLAGIPRPMKADPKNGWQKFVDSVIASLKKVLGNKPNGTVLNAALDIITAEIAIDGGAASSTTPTEAETTSSQTVSDGPISTSNNPRSMYTDHEAFMDEMIKMYREQSDARVQNGEDALGRFEDKNGKPYTNKQILNSVGFKTWWKQPFNSKKNAAIADYNNKQRGGENFTNTRSSDFTDQEVKEIQDGKKVSRAKLVSMSDKLRRGIQLLPNEKEVLKIPEVAEEFRKLNEERLQAEQNRQEQNITIITIPMRRDLRKLGWNDVLIDKMSVQEATQRIKDGVPLSELQQQAEQQKVDAENQRARATQSARKNVTDKFQKATNLQELYAEYDQVIAAIEMNIDSYATTLELDTFDLEALLQENINRLAAELKLEDLYVGNAIQLQNGQIAVVDKILEDGRVQAVYVKGDRAITLTKDNLSTLVVARYSPEYSISKKEGGEVGKEITAEEADISNESKKLESETEFEDSIDKGVSPEDAQKNFEDSLNKRCKK